MALKSPQKIFFLASALILWATACKQPENISLIRNVGSVSEYQLKSNGLQILLLEDHSTPVATVMMTYLAGLGNESNYPKQVAHLLEHMLMKATKHYNRQTGQMQFEALQSVGALMNAETDKDRTVYYETLPASGVPLALDIQADRMRNALINLDDVEREKKVVQDELYGLANSSFVLLSERVERAVFRKHPYGNGSASARFEVKNLSQRDVRKFYDAYYWPNNAALTVVGDFNSEAILKIIDEKFGKIKHSPKTIPTLQIQEPDQQRKRRVVIFGKDEVGAILISHKIPPATHPDFLALQILSEILSSGRTSRLYQTLVETGLSAGVGSEASKLKADGLFTAFAYVASGVKHREAGDMILKTYADIKTNGISDQELVRAKERIKAKTVFDRDGSFETAAQISESVALGNPSFFETYLGDIQKVSAEDVKRVANTYLTPEKMTLGFLISKQKSKIDSKTVIAKKDPGTSLRAKRSNLADSELLLQSDVRRLPRRSEGLLAMTDNAKPLDWNHPIADQAIAQSIHGIKVICVKTGAKDFISVTGSFEGIGSAFSKRPLLSELTVAMLGRATKQHDAQELAEILENRGIEISFGSDYKRLNFRIRSLKEYAALALKLLAEDLADPIFTENEFRKLKEETQVDILEKMNDPFERGYLEFKRSIYQPGHPNYPASFEEKLKSLETIKLKDIEAFYKSHLAFKNFTFVIVGDVDPDSIAQVFNQSFAEFNIKDISIPYIGTTTPSIPVNKTVSISGKDGIEAFLGHEVPLSRSDPDYLAASLGNFILGGNFSARLLSKIREEMALTYHIGSNFGGMAGNDLEGHWVVNFTAKPNSFEQAREETKQQIALFVEKGISTEELQRNKATMIGQFKVELATAENLAGWILKSEELGFGLGYLDQFPHLIEKLKFEEVNEAIRHYIRPDHLSIVIAGDVKGSKHD